MKVQRKLDVCGLLESYGWVCIRSVNSHGIDVMAAVGDDFVWHPAIPSDLRRMHVLHGLLFIKVKTTVLSPWEAFRPNDRITLGYAAQTAGAEAWLCWWPSLKAAPVWIAEADWPKVK